MVPLCSLLTHAMLGVPPLADVYVDQAAPNCTAGSGSSSSPVCTITSAIGLAAPGDTIRIAPGVYVENVTLDFDLDLIGTSGSAVTIVDGGAAGSVIRISSAVDVFIDGLTIRNGLADSGGGILLNGSLDLTNSVVASNVATGVDGGGGIEGRGPDGFQSLTISNSTISGNSATGLDGPGGGISVTGGGMLRIDNCDITGNQAINSGYGGGIESRGTALITNTTIQGNAAYNYGAGIHARGELTMRDSAVSYNQSDFSGGGIGVYEATLILENCTVNGNTCLRQGGGIFLYPGSHHFEFTNTTISGNSAERRGGGVWAFFNPAFNYMTNVTITGNTAMQEGGGLFLFDGRLELLNTIIAGNFSNLDPETHDIELRSGPFMGVINSLGTNRIGIGVTGITNGVFADYAGTVQAPLDPGLDPFLTPTTGRTFAHRLLPTSSAIDAANPLDFPETDQDGVERPFGGAPDIGAVESDIDNSLSHCIGNGGDQLGCTACPCGNDAPPESFGGCLNSSGSSTRLGVWGSRSVSLPPGQRIDLRVMLRGAPPSSMCLLVSADTTAPVNGANPCFGLASGVPAAEYDGLRCAVQNLRRHGLRTSDTNGDVGVTSPPWGGEAGPGVGLAVAFGGFLAGQVRTFQVVHTDDPLLVCMRARNSSQAVSITFEP